MIERGIFLEAVRRVAFLAVILFLVFAASRAIVRALPGDPLDTILAETGTSIPREVLRKELGLDRPFAEAVRSDLSGVLRGDFGTSMIARRPVGPLIASRVTSTLALAAVALVAGLAVSVFLGLVAAARPGGDWDRFCSVYGGLSAALPTPWIGPLLIYLFTVAIPLTPRTGSLWLPALTLAIGFSGVWSRLIRQRVRDTLVSGAAPGARARGVPEWKVLVKYGLAPASGALLAYLGTQTGAILSGSFVAEVIFDRPGMGSLLVDAVLHRDYPVVEAAAFVGAAFALAGTAIGDWAQSMMDPRV